MLVVGLDAGVHEAILGGKGGRVGGGEVRVGALDDFSRRRGVVLVCGVGEGVVEEALGGGDGLVEAGVGLVGVRRAIGRLDCDGHLLGYYVVWSERRCVLCSCSLIFRFLLLFVSVSSSSLNSSDEKEGNLAASELKYECLDNTTRKKVACPSSSVVLAVFYIQGGKETQSSIKSCCVACPIFIFQIFSSVGDFMLPLYLIN